MEGIDSEPLHPGLPPRWGEGGEVSDPSIFLPPAEGPEPVEGEGGGVRWRGSPLHPGLPPLGGKEKRNRMTPRVERLLIKARRRRGQFWIRRQWWNDSLDRTDGQPIPIRLARAFERVLSKMPVKIGSEELIVGHHPQGDWDLIVRVDGKQLVRKTVGKDTAVDGGLYVAVDLSSLADKTDNLELLNQPKRWSYKAGYWAKIAIESE